MLFVSSLLVAHTLWQIDDFGVGIHKFRTKLYYLYIVLIYIVSRTLS